MAKAKSATKHAQGIFRSDDLTCFYTGLKLKIDVPATDQLRLTVEHLIPVNSVQQGNHLIQRNMVPAAGFINTIIGNAPLIVKFGLKKHLSGLAFHPAMDEEGVILAVKACIKVYMDQFRLHKHYVWAWRGYHGKGNLSAETKTRAQRELYEAYYKLLLPEEIALGAYSHWDSRPGFGERERLDWKKLMVDTV